jgi:predicted CopG family antitoxin
MATKTLSIELDVYEKLKDLKQSPAESFSQVLRRLLSGRRVLTGSDIVRMIDEGSYPNVGLTAAELERLEEIQRHDTAIGEAEVERRRKAG